jgi:delta 1-pyrroline-5-carboxylate dehydrogenase
MALFIPRQIPAVKRFLFCLSNPALKGCLIARQEVDVWKGFRYHRDAMQSPPSPGEVSGGAMIDAARLPLLIWSGLTLLAALLLLAVKNLHKDGRS